MVLESHEVHLIGRYFWLDQNYNFYTKILREKGTPLMYPSSKKHYVRAPESK